MAMEDFAKEVVRTARHMTPSQRISRIRNLAKSPETEEFLQKYLPELYAEAFPASTCAGGGLTESHQPHELCAKPS
jgi:hypothetical protein